MTPGRTEVLPAPVAPSPPAVMLGLAVATALVVASGFGAVALVALPFLLGCVAALAGEPKIFLWILVAISGVGVSWMDAGLAIGSRRINLGGMQWGLVCIISALLLIRMGWPRVPRFVRPYIAFVALAGVGLLYTPDRFEGLKNFMQYLTPLVVFAVALHAIRTHEDVAHVLSVFWVSLGVALAVALMLWLGGLRGENAEFSGIMGTRNFAIYLVPLYALALAGFRYRNRAYIVLAALTLVVAGLTLSRTVVATMVALLWFAAAGTSLRSRLAVLGLVLLLGFLALQWDPLRARFLPDPSMPFDLSNIGVSVGASGPQLALGSIDLTGRAFLWPAVWLHALESPWLGHGTGASHYFLAAVLQLPGHPHNDYLRVLHDFGVVGLVLLLSFAYVALRFLYDAHREAGTPLVAQLSLAAALTATAYFMIALTDNILVYVSFFTQNMFLLFALAVRAQELRGSSDDAPAVPQRPSTVGVNE